MQEKRYRVSDPRTGSDILGGPVPYENVYISQYPSPLEGQPHPKELKPGQSTKVQYTLSGATKTTADVCVISCLEDEPPASEEPASEEPMTLRHSSPGAKDDTPPAAA